MAKVAFRIAIGWRVAGNPYVMSSSEYRPIQWARVYGISSSWAIFPCLRQFNRCPSWFVHQWKQKCFGVVLPPTAGSYQRKIVKKLLKIVKIVLMLTLGKVESIDTKRIKCNDIKTPRQTLKHIFSNLKRIRVWHCICRTSRNILKPIIMIKKKL